MFLISSSNSRSTLETFLSLLIYSINFSIRAVEAISLFKTSLSFVGTRTTFSTSIYFSTILGIWTILGNLMRSSKRTVSFWILSLTYGVPSLLRVAIMSLSCFLRFVHKAI